MQFSQKCQWKIIFVLDLLPASSGISLIELHKNLGLLAKMRREVGGEEGGGGGGGGEGGEGGGNANVGKMTGQKSN